MVKYNTKRVIPITEDSILARTTEYDIFAYYIGYNFVIGSKFNSPLRKDKSPSFGIFISNRSNRLLFKDLSTGQSGNCFKFVQLLLHLSSYKEALKKINEDLNLNFMNPSTKGIYVKNHFKASKTKISVRIRPFTKYDLEYWQSYNITEEILNKFNVYSISNVWVNDTMLPIKSTAQMPMYAYQVYNKFKIYRPFADKANKWLSNCTQLDLQGYAQLPEKGNLLIITKSLKDVMVLYSLGYTAIAANSENTIIPNKIIRDLKNRFTDIIIFFDNDETGILGAAKLKELYEIPYVYIPQELNIKDISDYIQINKTEKTTQILSTLIKT